ncbi:uncharacterized protein [Pocillopora verrucosa]|uniref:uncharacterized protein n=1 Tax=Pocillopora verrucosa TaxID=203993 RepID=UPI00333E2634
MCDRLVSIQTYNAHKRRKATTKCHQMAAIYLQSHPSPWKTHLKRWFQWPISPCLGPRCRPTKAVLPYHKRVKFKKLIAMNPEARDNTNSVLRKTARMKIRSDIINERKGQIAKGSLFFGQFNRTGHCQENTQRAIW